MTTPSGRYLPAVVDLVVRHGGDPDDCRAVADYLADRIADMRPSSVHSGRCSPRNDPHLLHRLGLSRKQVGAWLALLCGTREVTRPDGRHAGGHPGMIGLLAHGALGDEHAARFARLATIAAGPARVTGSALARSA